MCGLGSLEIQAQARPGHRCAVLLLPEQSWCVGMPGKTSGRKIRCGMAHGEYLSPCNKCRSPCSFWCVGDCLRSFAKTSAVVRDTYCVAVLRVLVSGSSCLQMQVGFGIWCFRSWQRFGYCWDLGIRKMELYRVVCSTKVVPRCPRAKGEVGKKHFQVGGSPTKCQVRLGAALEYEAEQGVLWAAGASAL